MCESEREGVELDDDGGAACTYSTSRADRGWLGERGLKLSEIFFLNVYRNMFWWEAQRADVDSG